MSGAIGGIEVETKWVKLGLVIGSLHFAFLLVLLYLLTIDVTLGLAFAVVGSIVGGVALMVFVLYVY
ncbi:MAG: hypothetical protein ACQEQY_01165 [Halobacteriota archaeon]